MVALQCSEAVISAWLRSLTRITTVLFPQPGPHGGFHFHPVTQDSAIGFGDYRPSQSPPGKLFTPSDEVLLRFEGRERGFVAHPVFDEQQRILAGVRPCDLRAIHLMDTVQADTPADPHYLARREQTTIIAWACATPCSERCFCDAVGALDSRQGADIMLSPLPDEQVLAEALTESGEALLASLKAPKCDDPAAARAEHEAARPKPFGRQLKADVPAIQSAMQDAWRSAVWQRHSEACLACGTCNLVCPTCYCFDTYDELDMQAPGSGQRCRTWDGCMLREFASVAGGHEFRGTIAARHRHRIKRKFEYLPERYEGAFCVGCGRCGTQCTVDIDIFDMVNEVIEEVRA